MDEKLFEELKENLKKCLEESKRDEWDCGCPAGAEDECVSVICPRK